MLSINEIPQEWKDLLSELQAIHRKVVIAGGALRDLDHGLAPKDLDIFIGCGDAKEAEELNEALGGEPVEGTDQWYQGGAMSELILVTDGPMVGDLQSQFIFLNWDVFHIMDRFDYTLCQIMFDGKSLIVTDDYKKDKDEKLFRVVRSGPRHAMERSVERYARWKPKFPDHHFKIDVDSLYEFGVSSANP